MPDGNYWSDEEDAILRQWRDLKSTSLIAELLPGRSKGAICGRMQRLGMARTDGKKWAKEFRPHPQQKMTAVPEKRIPQPVPKKPPPPPPPPEPPTLDVVWQPLPDTIPVDLMDLQQRHCRWPVTGGSCGVDTGGTHVYCGAHKQVARAK